MRQLPLPLCLFNSKFNFPSVEEADQAIASLKEWVPDLNLQNFYRLACKEQAVERYTFDDLFTMDSSFDRNLQDFLVSCDYMPVFHPLARIAGIPSLVKLFFIETSSFIEYVDMLNKQVFSDLEKEYLITVLLTTYLSCYPRKLEQVVNVIWMLGNPDQLRVVKKYFEGCIHRKLYSKECYMRAHTTLLQLYVDLERRDLPGNKAVSFLEWLSDIKKVLAKACEKFSPSLTGLYLDRGSAVPKLSFLAGACAMRQPPLEIREAFRGSVPPGNQGWLETETAETGDFERTLAIAALCLPTVETLTRQGLFPSAKMSACREEFELVASGGRAEAGY